MQTDSPGFIAHTRVFAPKFGYLEDPATGSGNSAFANYMLKHKLWDGAATKVEQGGDNIVFNSVCLMKSGHEILFGGSATTRIAGEYYMV
jgi:predicted PhzF superfamily epimerase YddE/YHI9